jgi:hypothetical protein
MSDNILGGADSENVIWGIILRDFWGAILRGAPTRALQRFQLFA